MLNTPEAYTEAGILTAKARKQNDESRAQFNRRWFDKAVSLEKPEHRQKARRLYEDGYKKEMQP